MSVKVKKFIYRIVCFAVCIAVIITSAALICCNGSQQKDESGLTMLKIWQIDGFEGGKGSRTAYLQTIGDKFYKTYKAYIAVTSLSASAARENIKAGARPDLISYAAGMYGIEQIICGKTAYYTWAHGGYCLLTVDPNADFCDITAQNTIINAGTDNLAGVAALFCGLDGAAADKPTAAYVKLLGRKFKYLLGTQRDIFRLKSREAAFKIKPVTAFNDLYQNISITTGEPQRQYLAQKFIEMLLAESGQLQKIGLMGDEKIYDDEMSVLEGLKYEFTLRSPVSFDAHNAILEAVEKSDINLLKNLLK